MKLGLISDAHGNPFGLEVCLRAFDTIGVDRVYFLGDAVGYFPEENEVLAQLQARGAICLRGNHEAMLLGDMALSPARDEVYRLTEARARIEPRFREWIASWPDRLELELDDQHLLFVHGSPKDPLGGYIYPDSDLSDLGAGSVDLVAMGQTHRPFEALVENLRVLNIGSCGMPRDVGNLASCATYDTSRREVDVLRVRFDAAALQERWSGRIHDSAYACLGRISPSPAFGRVL